MNSSLHHHQTIVNKDVFLNLSNSAGGKNVLHTLMECKDNVINVNYKGNVKANSHIQNGTALNYAAFHGSFDYHASGEEYVHGVEGIEKDYSVSNNKQWIESLLAHPHIKVNSSFRYNGENEEVSAATKVTSLMMAVHHGDMWVVDRLVRRGANPTLRDSNGKNSIDRAIDTGGNDVLQIMLKPKLKDVKYATGLLKALVYAMDFRPLTDAELDNIMTETVYEMNGLQLVAALLQCDVKLENIVSVKMPRRFEIISEMLEKRRENAEEPLDLNIPLNHQNHRVYGQPDSTDRDLPLELACIEGASEQWRYGTMGGTDNGMLEIMMQTVINMSGWGPADVAVLPSISIYVKNSWQAFADKDAFDEMKEHLYTESIKQSARESQYVVTIVGLISHSLSTTSSEESGHYVAMMADAQTGEVVIYDSMQTGEYSQYHLLPEIAAEIFTTVLARDPGIVYLTSYAGGRRYHSVQPTGGFLDFRLSPPHLKKIKNKKLRERLFKQHDESQNHFCYMWSIWVIYIIMRQLKLSHEYGFADRKREWGKSIDYAEERIRDISSSALPNVMFVKTFILEMYSRTRPIKGLSESEVEYFETWFPCVWSNHMHPLEDKFLVYDIHDYEDYIRDMIDLD